MLVLSRKLGESLEIGDQRVIVHVLGIRGGSRVQLGVEAPREVSVHRSEKSEKTDRSQPVHDRMGETPSSKPAGCTRSDALARSDSGSGRADVERAELPFGESVLEDVARVQAEIAALAELVSGRDLMVARQIAGEAIERLAAIERTVRVARRGRGERPMADFLRSRVRGADRANRETAVTNLIREGGTPFRTARASRTPTLVKEASVDHLSRALACGALANVDQGPVG